MRTVTLIALGAVLGAASGGLAACSKKSGERPPQTVAGQGIELVNAGAMPQHPLRYQLTRGAKTRVQLEIDFDATMPSIERIMPTMVMVMEIGADEILPDGSAKVASTIVRASARDRPNASLAIEAVNAQATLMGGMAITGTLSPRGKMSDGKLAGGGKELPKPAADQLKDAVAKISELAMPLPEQAVGVGAIWRYRKAITVEQIAMDTVTEIEVTAIDGPRVTYVSRIQVEGKPQTIALADEQGGSVKLDVKNIRGNGTGKGVLDLTRMVGTGEQSSELAFDVSLGEHTGTAKLKTATRMLPPDEQDATAPAQGSPGAATGSAGAAAGSSAGSGAGSAADDPSQDHHP
jgi:hypothetical protein